LRIDRIAEAPLLADLLEEARGHAAAERGRIDLRGVEVGVPHARGLEPEREMDLFEVLHLAPLAALPERGLEALAADRGEIAEGDLGGPHHLVVIDRAGGREDHLVWPVMLADEAGEVLAPEGRDPLRRAEDGAAERLAGEGGFLQPVEDDVV